MEQLSKEKELIKSQYQHIDTENDGVKDNIKDVFEALKQEKAANAKYLEDQD